MKLEKDKLYISFHKGTGLIGTAIALWTLGKYSHCEFVINDYVYYTNPGGVRIKPFINKDKYDLFPLHENIDPCDIVEFCTSKKGTGYDYLGILGQFFYAGNLQKNDKYFCSEFCLNAIDYALQFTLTYNLKSLKDRVGYAFSPNKLYKYLKFMELIGEKER